MDLIELQASALEPGDLSGIAQSLREAGLPADDITEPGVTLFTFRRGDTTVGYGGLEFYGADALLRSVVVVSHRGQGNGRRIVEMLLDQARNAGVRGIYLLTNDAHGYFEKIGFSSVERSAAPPSIAATRQMSSICPSSSVLMVKELAR